MASQWHDSEDVDELGYNDDGPSSTKKQKKTRTRDGCLTCRKAKKGCDKAHPQCMRCKRLNYACEWPLIKSYPQARASSSRRLLPESGRSSITNDSEEATTAPADWTMVQHHTHDDAATARRHPAVAIPALDFSAPATPVASSSRSSIMPAAMDHEDFLQPVLQPSISAYSTASPPSNALDAQFWQDNSLYTFDFDTTDVDTLLRLAGLPVPGGGSQSNEVSAITTTLNSSSHIMLSKDKLDLLSKFFPPRVVAMLQRLVMEQQNSNEVKLPLAYVVSICLWCPSSAVEGLLQAAKNTYSGLRMQSMLKDLGEVAWTFLTRMTKNPASHPKIVFPPETVATMPISLSAKLFALMDIAYRQAVVEGSAAYYKVVAVMERCILEVYKPGHLFNVADVNRVNTVYLYNFVLVDIFRAIELGQGTTFAYYYTPSPNEQLGTSLAVGNSDAILCIMAEISSFRFLLDRDVNSRTPDDLNLIYQAKADEILRKIEANPAVPLHDEIVDLEEGLDSVQAVASMATQEAWRQAALVYYYQSIWRRSPKYEQALQKSCQQILKLFPITQMGFPHRNFGLFGLPLFMAATVASNDKDQKACLDAFGTLSVNCKIDDEIIRFFKGIWKDSEDLGRPVDWLDYASVETGPLYF